MSQDDCDSLLEALVVLSHSDTLTAVLQGIGEEQAGQAISEPEVYFRLLTRSADE